MNGFFHAAIQILMASCEKEWIKKRKLQNEERHKPFISTKETEAGRAWASLGNLVRLYLTIKIKTRAGDIGQLLSSCLGSPSGGMGPRPPHRLASKLLHFCFYSFALVQFFLEFYVLSSWPAEARALYSNLSHLSPSPQFRICCFLKSLPSLTHTLLTAGARQ